MGFFFGTGPEWEEDSLNRIQVVSVFNGQERNSSGLIRQNHVDWAENSTCAGYQSGAAIPSVECARIGWLRD
jgi:hypothetical protein